MDKLHKITDIDNVEHLINTNTVVRVTSTAYRDISKPAGEFPNIYVIRFINGDSIRVNSVEGL